MPQTRFFQLPLFHSFQMKLFLIFSALTALISLVFCSLFVVFHIRQAERHVSEELRLMAHHLSDSIRLPLYAEDRTVLKQLAAEVADALPELRRVRIRTIDGRILAEVQAASPSAGNFRETVEVRSRLGASVETAVTEEQGPAEGVLIGTVELERGAGDLSRNIAQIVAAATGITLCFWVAVSLLSYLVLRRVTGSFRTLIQGVQQMQGGEYGTRIPVVTDDEPGRAAAAINELAQSLLHRDEENRRLNETLLKAMEQEVASKEALAAVNRSLEEEIADRIRAEQAVRENEGTLKELLDFLPIGIAWTDHSGRIEYLNHFVTERFGYTREEIRTLDELFGRTASGASTPAPSTTGVVGVPLHEARITCKDGTVRHILFKTQLFRDRHLIVLMDITDRELFQEQLIKAQKLESLGVLAGGIAHNFNNVLTGVLGYISYARRFLDSSHKAVMPLVNAEKASRRAAGMATQLLTFARGGSSLKKPLSITRLIEESLSLSLRGADVQCIVDLPESLHPVKGDEGQLSQVFNNIIINAVQAMADGGGTLAIRAENVSEPPLHLQRGSAVEYVRIIFSDTGHGIPAADIKKIFDPYFTTKSSGTGLGLASVHSIIYKHGGQIAVESTVGKGTAFTICLPATAEVPHAEAVMEVPLPGCQGAGSILVMDDEEVVRSFAKESLGFFGYRVTSCSSGEEAIELYKSGHQAGDPFHAAILDLTITRGIGGAEAARQILAFDPAARLIVSSGYSFDPVMADYRKYGFCAAISKPYKAEEICQELARLQP